MRICMLAYAFYENDNRIIRYAETLVRRGDAVDVICLRKPGEVRAKTINGVRLFRVQSRRRNEMGRMSYLARMLLFQLKAMARVSFYHLRRPYQVVHVHNVPDFLVFAALIPRWLGARVILDLHDLLPEFYANKFKTLKSGWTQKTLLGIERCSVCFADKVIVSNELWRDRVAKRCGSEEKTIALPNHVDLALFWKRPRTRADKRWIIIYAGGLQRHQGVDLAIAALPRVRAAVPDAVLHIYGDGPELPQLKRQVENLGLGEAVRFEKPVPLMMIPEILANADVGVVPKRADSFGNEAYSTKIMELMSQGVPVVAARTAIDYHYFGDSQVAYFLPGDVNDLALRLTQVAVEPGLRQRLIDSGLAYCRKNCWETKSGEYLQVVDSFGAQRSGS